jgi:hypothetical protein
MSRSTTLGCARRGHNAAERPFRQVAEVDERPVAARAASLGRRKSRGEGSLLAGKTTIDIVDRDERWRDVLNLHRAGSSLPARRARDHAKGEAAEVRNRTAWQRVAWAIDGLHALLVLRDELLDREHELWRDMQNAGGLHHAPPQLFDELALRTTQVREVLVAFVSQGKVLLDLLAQAVAAALGNPGGFQEKHGSLGKRLDGFARALGVAAPPDELVERARDLDRDVADVRDDLLVHPKLSGDYARQFVHPRGGDLEISTLFPNEEEEEDEEEEEEEEEASPMSIAEQEASLIAIAKVDSALDAYTRDVVRWVASVLNATSPLGDTPSSNSSGGGESSA